MDNKTTFIITFVSVFCGIGLVFSIIALAIKLSRDKKVRLCTSKAEGTITGLKRRASGGAGHAQVSYHPVIRYMTADGKAVEKESAFGGSEGRYTVGQSVAVFYDLNDPEVFYLPDDKIAKILILVFSLVGIGLFLIGAITSILVYIFA